MKVYEIKEGGETTHITFFDGNKKEALKWYISETGCDEDEIKSFTVLARKKWKDITIKYDEEDLEETLEEHMKGHNWNEIICSTAFL